ncbi:13710_t:CDS:1, partial [Cetraspora pellucida]
PYTRKINILGSGNEPFALTSNKCIIVLNVPRNLPQDSLIIVSFKHPPSHYEPKFIAKIKSYQFNKILFDIHCHDYESSDSEETNEDSKSFDDEVYDDSKSINIEDLNRNPKSFDNEDVSKDSKSFDNEDMNEDSKSFDDKKINKNKKSFNQKHIIESASPIKFGSLSSTFKSLLKQLSPSSSYAEGSNSNYIEA